MNNYKLALSASSKINFFGFVKMELTQTLKPNLTTMQKGKRIRSVARVHWPLQFNKYIPSYFSCNKYFGLT